MTFTLALDIGNTRGKMALFDQEGQLLASASGAGEALTEQARDWAGDLPEGSSLRMGWLSTSHELEPTAWAWLENRPGSSITRVHAQLPWPFPHDYLTAHTLGADRFAGIVAACNLALNQPVLVVDAGTAITYDLATAEPRYLGGAISPGIQMRYDALHHFTARLPALRAERNPPDIGKSTAESMQTGVERAVCSEVEGMIVHFEQQMGPGLQVFLTGGDGPYFEKQLKRINFADNSLVLRGIFFILQHIAST